MSGRFDDFDRVVMDMMSDFGFTTTYIHRVSATPNDSTGTVTIVTEDIEIQAIKMELIRPMEGSGNKTGTLIKDGDQILYVRPTEKSDVFADAISVDTTYDYIEINDVNWRVVTVKEYNPSASDCILYELYIRK